MGNRVAKVSEEKEVVDRKEEEEEDDDDDMVKHQENSTLLSLSNSSSSSSSRVEAGRVYGMGNAVKGELGIEGKTCSPPQVIVGGDIDKQCIVTVSAGHHFSVALTDEGYLYTWGSSGLSKESLRKSEEEREDEEEESKNEKMLSKSVPRMIIMPSSHIRISCVSAAGNHVLAVSTHGRIFSWGEGKDGTLGHGNRMFSENRNSRSFLPLSINI